LDGQEGYLHFKFQTNLLVGGHVNLSQLAMQYLETSLSMGHIRVPFLSMGNTPIEVGIFAARLDVRASFAGFPSSISWFIKTR
jgi:hypothetical protein